MQVAQKESMHIKQIANGHCLRFALAVVNRIYHRMQFHAKPHICTDHLVSVCQTGPLIYGLDYMICETGSQIIYIDWMDWIT